LTVQVPVGESVTPVQASALLAKSEGFVPPTLTPRMASLAVPVFVTVTLLAALVVRGAWGGNTRLRGDKDAESERKLATKFEALTVPIPVAKSHPVPAAKAG
jgi:hypothetical protein